VMEPLAGSFAVERTSTTSLVMACRCLYLTTVAGRFITGRFNTGRFITKTVIYRLQYIVRYSVWQV